MNSAPPQQAFNTLCFSLHDNRLFTTTTENQLRLAVNVQYSVTRMRFSHSLQVSAGRRPPTEFVARSKMTHRIRIPLASHSFRLRLQKSLNQLRDDHITGALPYAAWFTVDRLSITLEELSLRSHEEVEAASDLLQNLGNPFSTFIEENKELEQLHVTLRDLTSGGKSGQEKRAHTNRLYWSVAGSAALDHLRRDVPAALRRRNLFILTSEFEKRLERPPTVKVMDTRSLTSEVPNTKTTLASYNLTRLPVFDATDLYAKYGDTVWAESIPLEKLCISTIGMKDLVKGGNIIGQGYEDVSTVLLPGAPRSALEVDPDIQYIRAAGSYI